MTNKGKKWTVEEEDIVLKEYHNKSTVYQIAKMLNRPYQTVIAKMWKMDLSVSRYRIK